MSIYPSQTTQVACLQGNKILNKIFAKYANYSNVFLPNLINKLPKNTHINEHAIEMIEGKQPLYELIYILNLVELETLKTYIKTYLTTGFIWFFKSLAVTLIFFDKKLNNSFCLCVNYQGLNNLTIKNWY